jgi:tellurite resistance protein TehA-like permease
MPLYIPFYVALFGIVLEMSAVMIFYNLYFKEQTQIVYPINIENVAFGLILNFVGFIIISFAFSMILKHYYERKTIHNRYLFFHTAANGDNAIIDM